MTKVKTYRMSCGTCRNHFDLTKQELRRDLDREAAKLDVRTLADLPKLFAAKPVEWQCAGCRAKATAPARAH